MAVWNAEKAEKGAELDTTTSVIGDDCQVFFIRSGMYAPHSFVESALYRSERPTSDYENKKKDKAHGEGRPVYIGT
jgi:hypothetical protein